MMLDCILCTVSSGTTTTAVIATTDPAEYYDKADDYFNQLKHEAYCYEGTNIGVVRNITDWVNSTHTATLSPAAGSDYAASSKLELHHIFTETEYRNAINQAISMVARTYFIRDDDETIHMTEDTDNDGNTSYDREYDLDLSMLGVYRVMVEGSEKGKKITGTISGAFTVGETVNFGTSGASAILCYTDTTNGYIHVRDVSGTPETGETATGATSSETCSTITAIEDATVGSGKFPVANELDYNSWSIMKAYTPKLKLDESVTITDGLRFRISGQCSQAKVSSDTDNIFLPPDWLSCAAVTFLPTSKIEKAGLMDTLKQCVYFRDKYMPTAAFAPNVKRVIE